MRGLSSILIFREKNPRKQLLNILTTEQIKFNYNRCIFNPVICEQLKQDLEKTNFITVATDASNHNNIKMFPIMLIYFLPEDRIKNSCVEVSMLS